MDLESVSAGSHIFFLKSKKSARKNLKTVSWLDLEKNESILRCQSTNTPQEIH